MKKNLILLLVFVVLVAVGMIYQWSLNQRSVATEKANNFLNAINLTQLKRLEIKTVGAKNNVILMRTDLNQPWQLLANSSTIPADQNSIKEFVGSLQQAGTSTVTLISQQKNRQSEFRTDGKSSTYFRLVDNNNTFLTMNVGQSASSGLGTYVSLVGEDETWMLPGDWAVWLSKTDWQAGTSSPAKKIKN